MSLFEWLGESINPGPTGQTHIGPRGREKQPRIIILLRAFLSIILIGAVFAMMAGPMGIREFDVYRNTAIAISIYSFVAYFVHPEADESNLGWCGGFIDDPTRISDDHNRFLLAFALILAPGRFFAESVVDTVRLIADATRKSKPPGA